MAKLGSSGKINHVLMHFNPLTLVLYFESRGIYFPNFPKFFWYLRLIDQKVSPEGHVKIVFFIKEQDFFNFKGNILMKSGIND